MSLVLNIIPKRLLPPYNDRKDSVVYFCYDKLEIYLGQGFYNDSYCIVEKPIPATRTDENGMEVSFGIEGMMYIILTDGTMPDGEEYHAGDIWTIGYLNNNLKEIKMAEIAPFEITDELSITVEEMLNILSTLGTTYFQKAEYKYYDNQTRTLVLPYQNGDAVLSVDAKENLRFDENTVLKYNPLTGKFEYDDNYIDPDELSDPKSGLRGYSTSTADTRVLNNQLHVDIKLSQTENNGLRVLSDGLYINLVDYAKKNQFDELVSDFVNWKNDYDAKIEELQRMLDEDYSEEALRDIANDILIEYKPRINEMFSAYNEIYDRLNLIYQAVPNYIDDKFLQTKNEILFNAHLHSPDNFRNILLSDNDGHPLILSDSEADYIANAIRDAKDYILNQRNN